MAACTNCRGDNNVHCHQQTHQRQDKNQSRAHAVLTGGACGQCQGGGPDPLICDWQPFVNFVGNTPKTAAALGINDDDFAKIRHLASMNGIDLAYAYFNSFVKPVVGILASLDSPTFTLGWRSDGTSLVATPKAIRDSPNQSSMPHFNADAFRARNQLVIMEPHSNSATTFRTLSTEWDPAAFARDLSRVVQSLDQLVWIAVDSPKRMQPFILLSASLLDEGSVQAEHFVVDVPNALRNFIGQPGKVLTFYRTLKTALNTLSAEERQHVVIRPR